MWNVVRNAAAAEKPKSDLAALRECQRQRRHQREITAKRTGRVCRGYLQAYRGTRPRSKDRRDGLDR